MGFLAKALLGQQISLSMVPLSTLSMYKVSLMGTRWFSEIKVSNRSLQHSREIDAVPVSRITICIGPRLLLCLVLMPQGTGALTEILQFPSGVPALVLPQLSQKCSSRKRRFVLRTRKMKRCLLLNLRETGLQILTDSSTTATCQ